MDGTKLDGTYTTGDGYITNIDSNVNINIIFPQKWKLEYEFYRPSTRTDRGLLWNIGTDINNCKLIGYNSQVSDDQKDLAIFNRINGTNTTCDNNLSPDYNNDAWTNAEITFDGLTITLTVGNTILTCNSTHVTNICKIYSYSKSRLRNIRISAI